MTSDTLKRLFTGIHVKTFITQGVTWSTKKNESNKIINLLLK